MSDNVTRDDLRRVLEAGIARYKQHDTIRTCLVAMLDALDAPEKPKRMMQGSPGHPGEHEWEPDCEFGTKCIPVAPKATLRVGDVLQGRYVPTLTHVVTPYNRAELNRKYPKELQLIARGQEK